MSQLEPNAQHVTNKIDRELADVSMEPIIMVK